MDFAQDSFISSTFWTERIGYVAALATINKMGENNIQKDLEHYGDLINEGWTKLAELHGLKICISGISPLTHIKFEDANPLAIQTLYAQEMLKNGYLLGSAIYSTYAYSDQIINKFHAPILYFREVTLINLHTYSSFGEILFARSLIIK